jgi:hypothetical protein
MTATTRLPIRLESLRIATPCAADWDDMKGDDFVRFCGRCEQHVYDLSALSRVEAEQLVAEKEGQMCARFYQRADGTVLTNDCSVAVRRERLRQRIWSRIAGAATSAALLVGLWSGRARADLAVGDGKATTATKPMPKGRLVVVKTPPVEKDPQVDGDDIAMGLIGNDPTQDKPKAKPPKKK